MSYYVDVVRKLLAEEMPEVKDSLLDFYTLLVLTRGVNTTEMDVHDAWSVWISRTDPEHRSLVPFRDLSAEVQALDAPYADAIVRTSNKLWDGQGLHLYRPDASEGDK